VIKLVILDFYGVLYSNFNWPVVDERIYSDEGKSQKFAYLKSLSNRGKLTNQEFRAEVAKLAHDNDNPNRPAVLATAKINDELIDIIRSTLPESKIVLLSNGNRPDVLQQIEECGIKDEFEHIYTSSDLKFLKPQIGVYIKVFHDYQVEPSDVVIIDDSPNHVAATKSYGFNTIKFNDNHSLQQELEKYKN
jgi:HAD superfamily hydrolase (TIGR01509 family)